MPAAGAAAQEGAASVGAEAKLAFSALPCDPEVGGDAPDFAAGVPRGGDVVWSDGLADSGWTTGGAKESSVTSSSALLASHSAEGVG